MSAQFEYHAVVYHCESEKTEAEAFCRRVRLIRLDRGQPPLIATMDDIAHPGRQDIPNLDSGLRQGRYVFFSQKYYLQDPFGQFSGNVAMRNAHADRFVRLHIGDTETDDEYMSFNSYGRAGLVLTETWGFTRDTEDKIKAIFNLDATVGLPELPSSASSGHLEVMNPSISSSVQDPPDNIAERLENADLVEDSRGAAPRAQAAANAARPQGRQTVTARVQPVP